MSGRILLDTVAEEEPKPPEPTPPPPPPSPPPEPPPAKEAVESPPESTPAPAAEALSPELQKRIDRLTWEKYEAQRRQQEAEQRYLQEQRRQQAAQRGYQRAQQESATARFNEACNSLYAKGRQEFGETMDEAVRGLNAVGWGNRPDALAALASLPDGHRVYHALASNLDEAHRVLNLPPMEMAVALASMRSQQSSNGHAEPRTPISRAPAPISPIGGQSRAPEKPLDKLTMREFITRRDRETAGSSTRIRR